MTKTIPSYLRVHRGNDSTVSIPVDTQFDSVESFWNAYSDATGWRIDKRETGFDAINLLPAVTTEGLEDLPMVSKSAATRLAQSAEQLTNELRQNRDAMRRQAAELASRASILSHQSDHDRLANGIEKTLADAAAACGCDAAAMYLLDDETQYLNARAVFGLPPTRLENDARSLRGSRADLEALVQGVVAIDDLTAGSIDTWNSPEPFAAGICAAILSDDVPIGTVWLFATEPTEFGVAESAAARLAAQQLSLQLAQPSLDHATAASADQPIRDISQWQCESLPIGAKLADDWRVDGMVESPRAWATGWHAWDILPDGTLMLAVAEATDGSARGAMQATIARAALTAHTGYRHTPAELMQRVSDTLWQTSTGEQLVSLLYVRIDPETGEGEVASAGSITAMIGSRYGYRPLVDGCSDPLNHHIDARPVMESFRMVPGETMLAYTPGLIADGATQAMLGDRIRSTMETEDANPLAAIRRDLAALNLTQERGAVTLTRQ